MLTRSYFDVPIIGRVYLLQTTYLSNNRKNTTETTNVETRFFGFIAGLVSDLEDTTGTLVDDEGQPILDENNKSLARGLSSFSSEEIYKIKGKQSKEIENILGYLSKSEIVHKDLKKNPMEVTVRFISEMITCIKNSKDEVISGSLNQVQKITDVWTFEKIKDKKTSNWLLTATSD